MPISSRTSRSLDTEFWNLSKSGEEKFQKSRKGNRAGDGIDAYFEPNEPQS